MLDNLEIISKEALLDRVHRLADDGYRFVTISCCDNGDSTLDLYYHLDHNLLLRTLKMTVHRDESIASLSRIYFAALLVENEIKELFGLSITGLVTDYSDRLLLSQGAPVTPMSREIKIIKRDKETQ